MPAFSPWRWAILALKPGQPIIWFPFVVSWTSVAGTLGAIMAGLGWASASQSDGILGGQPERFWSGVMRRGELAALPGYGRQRGIHRGYRRLPPSPLRLWRTGEPPAYLLATLPPLPNAMARQAGLKVKEAREPGQVSLSAADTWLPRLCPRQKVTENFARIANANLDMIQ
jgi:hypothetical protein